MMDYSFCCGVLKTLEDPSLLYNLHRYCMLSGCGHEVDYSTPDGKAAGLFVAWPCHVSKCSCARY